MKTKSIIDIIPHHSTVLDLGCGNGELLKKLQDAKNIKGQGIERNQQGIFQCIEKGLTVSHMDFETALSSYPDQSFDYVILNHSLQETLDIRQVLTQALRVGKRVIVGFPNFAHIDARIQLFFLGRTPITPALPHPWYNTPNLHFLSISDFRKYLSEHKIKTHHKKYFSHFGRIYFFPNLFARSAQFTISSSEPIQTEAVSETIILLSSTGTQK